MKVILLQDVKKVGQKGSVVEVADGYAQNVLIPRGLARVATPAAIKSAEAAAAGEAGRRAMSEAMAEAAMKKLDGQTVTISAKAGETGTLFESIHADRIAAAIEQDLGVTIPESAIDLDETIKKKGPHTIKIFLSGADASLTVSVI